MYVHATRILIGCNYGFRFLQRIRLAVCESRDAKGALSTYPVPPLRLSVVTSIRGGASRPYIRTVQSQVNKLLQPLLSVHSDLRWRKWLALEQGAIVEVNKRRYHTVP